MGTAAGGARAAQRAPASEHLARICGGAVARAAGLDRGGTLSIAGIYLTDIPVLSYERHLFQERQIRSVTSNTRQDGREFLDFAAAHRLAVTAHPYPLDAAAQALADLKAGRFDGAAVLTPGG